ncbi:MAG TPA: hypothetical protein VI386_10780 [Candidatus Sulfotelmatobacter sp.]
MNSQKCGFANSFFGVVKSAVLVASLLAAVAWAQNPVPQIVVPVKPQAVAPGSGAFTLTVYGANFVSGAVVNWNYHPRSTTFVSAHEVRAQILASDIAKNTAGTVTVTNPAPGGGNSSASYAQVEVHAPTATIVPGLTATELFSTGSPIPSLTTGRVSAFSLAISIMMANWIC